MGGMLTKVQNFRTWFQTVWTVGGPTETQNTLRNVPPSGILWPSTYQCTVHWKPVVTQLDMIRGDNQCWVGITNIPGHHPGIPVWSLEGITLSDALTENQATSSHVYENWIKEKETQKLRTRKDVTFYPSLGLRV